MRDKEREREREREIGIIDAKTGVYKITFVSINVQL